MLGFFIYFSGMVLIWIIGILFMKYCKGFVADKDDVDDALGVLIAISLFSWIIVIAFTVISIIYCIKQFIFNKVANWILEDKKEDPFHCHG